MSAAAVVGGVKWWRPLQRDTGHRELLPGTIAAPVSGRLITW